MKKIFLPISALLLAATLQGCIAGAVVAGGAAGCAIAADRRSFHTMADDEKIIYRTHKKINEVADLANNSHVVVVSYNHVVLLAGQTPTPELRSQAEQIAHETPNVRRVFNQITIEKPTGPMRRSKDTAITANVKTRFMATTNLSARQIKVVTENGTVFLLGVTTHEQANTAAEVAKNSTGVQRVVKLIEYVPSI